MIIFPALTQQVEECFTYGLVRPVFSGYIYCQTVEGTIEVQILLRSYAFLFRFLIQDVG